MKIYCRSGFAGDVVKRTAIFILLFLVALSVRAMSPLSESDLSRINNPLSLNINPHSLVDDNNTSSVDDNGIISKFLLNSIKLKGNDHVYLFKDNDDQQEISKRFSFFPLSVDKDDFRKVQFFFIDPATGKNYMAMINDDDTNDTYNNFSNIKVENTHTMAYPNDYTNSSNNPLTYTIMSGNIEMRKTYINQTKTTIQSGSWLDIKSR